MPKYNIKGSGIRITEDEYGSEISFSNNRDTIDVDSDSIILPSEWDATDPFCLSNITEAELFLEAYIIALEKYKEYKMNKQFTKRQLMSLSQALYELESMIDSDRDTEEYLSQEEIIKLRDRTEELLATRMYAT